MRNISLFGKIRGISAVSKKEQAMTLAGPTSEIELTDKELETIRGAWDNDGRRRHHHHHHHHRGGRRW